MGAASGTASLYVSGVQKTLGKVCVVKATTVSGVATFYLTDNALASGDAIFSNVYLDTIAVVAYGSAANYQPFNPAVSVDNKTLTISVNQASSVLLGLIQLVSASNGVDCRLYVMGE